MRAEFVGLPGSGKSYLCARLAVMIGDTGVTPKVMIRPPIDEQHRLAVAGPKLARAGVFAIRHPRTTVALIRCLRKTGQKTGRHQLAKTISLLSDLRQADGRATATLMEQGVVQDIWSVLLRARQDRVTELLSLCGPWLPTTVIRVTVDSEEGLRRLRARQGGRSRFDALADDELVREMEHGAELMDEILAGWRRMDAGHTTIEISNPRGVDPETALRGSLDAILDQLHGRRPDRQPPSVGS